MMAPVEITVTHAMLNRVTARAAAHKQEPWTHGQGWIIGLTYMSQYHIFTGLYVV